MTILILIYVLYKKHRIALVLGCISAVIIFGYFSHAFLSVIEDIRFVGRLHIDEGRFLILADFFLDLLKQPLQIFSGMGIENWSSQIHGQPPHNQVLHLISDYGIFLALVYLFTFYNFLFKINDQDDNSRLYSRILFLGTLPYIMPHTYTLERGHIIIFVIISFYLQKEAVILSSDKKAYETEKVSVA